MGLSSILRPGKMVETQEYITEYRDEYYSKPAHGKPYDHYPETGYYNNSGSSMQMMRPYPNIATPQAPHHHAVAQEEYYGYGKPHSHGKPDTDYGAGYYGNHHISSYKPPNNYGHGYENKPHSYEGHGHGNLYPGGTNRFESYTYYAENHGLGGQHGRGAEAAKWIARGIDD